MSLQAQTKNPIPEETQRVARAAFPKRNLYMRMRDELGEVCQDEQLFGIVALPLLTGKQKESYQNV